MSKEIKTQAEFRQMAEERIDEAKVLLAAAKWSGAYYLAGYAVELALKACIIKRLRATDAFPKRDFSRDCYTHDLDKLVRLADLNDARKVATDADADLQDNWASVNVWSEEKRYYQFDKAEAESLYTAIADGSHGVLPWIKTHW